MNARFALVLVHAFMMGLPVLLLAKGFPNPLPTTVEVLPAETTLFGKDRGDYLAEYMQRVIPLSTNGDYLLPHSVPSETDPVFFLQRPLFTLPIPGIQTYFVPDDAYVCFPIVFFWGDNVDTDPPFTIPELRDGVGSIVDVISGVYATFDGNLFTNLQAYRTLTPVFSMNFPSSDNFYSVILHHSLEGIVDPVVAGGYFIILKPLPAGLHDVRLGATIGGANNFSFNRHFQIHGLSAGQQRARETELLMSRVAQSDLPPHRQQPLQATLEAAHASFSRESLVSGMNQLRAFQRKVRAQMGRADEDLAIQWIQSAQEIIEKVASQPARTK